MGATVIWQSEWTLRRLLVTLLLLPPGAVRAVRDTVSIDLRSGIVRGYSHHVKFLRTPAQPHNVSSHLLQEAEWCGRQAVLEVLVRPGSRPTLVLDLQYSTPRLWTFHLSDSLHATGYQGRNFTEAHIVNRQWRVYGRGSGMLTGSLDGRNLLSVTDNVVQPYYHVRLYVSHHQLQWRYGRQFGGRRGAVAGKAVFSMAEAAGNTLYIGLNRIVGGPWRSGVGLCHLALTLLHGEPPSCTCHPQYLLAADGHSCIPSCAINNGGCERSCHNTATGVHCSCPRGFHLHHDQRTCLDVDECSGNGSGCEHRCINNHGSYECVCPMGFKLQPDERSCQDVNECAVDGTCEHFCTNTPGSYHCSCDVGYQLFAWTHCGGKDMNECSINNGGCSQICVNTDGSYYWRCRDGYSLHANRKDCLPTNKCTPFRNPTKAEVSCYHLEDYSYEERCTVRCREGAAFTSGSANYYVFTCGRHTDFTWRADPDVLNTSYLSCSDMWVTPGYKRLARLMVATRLDDNTTVESVLNGLTQALTEKMSYCSDKCQLRFVSEKLTNSKKLKKKLHLAPDQQVVRTKFEVVVFPTSPRQLCGRKCLKRYARRLKKTLLEHQSISSVTGHEYQLLPRTYKAGGRVKETCPEGFVHVGRKCVACSLGSYHDVEKGVCVACPASTYQPNEAKLKCLSCPVDDLPQAPYKTGARNLSQCSDVCPAGSWSADGFSPCQPCSSGSYQEDSGRVSCSSCLPSSTSPPGATSFFQCLSHGETCDRGHYWNLTSGQCESCPLGYYQHNTGASSCIQCPGSSTTDHIASTSLAACKRHACGGYVGELSGVFETPNYPGDYPDNARCTWVVKPAKGRRVLVVVPEIQLSHDQCGDYLVLRKSKSAYSAVTFETCSSVDRPVVFTSRSRRLWVHFRSDSNNTNKGFRIQFVTYNKEYHKLIKTIVRDNRLYSLHNHLAILRDRELLPRLLEVVAEPIKYYEYATEKDKLFPSSFIRLLTPKVRRFFSYRRRRK
ncbi:LOW QUALITY PROTEIN: signal peptide, CUB and EGF-like domain-containing protein 1 [Procambarus clarkii]|uniref:LOW QUALITY PROTEIN: signal peptide, CUB and EGF-like domain-containing protein 1 n=1 Tax=Procambarus clarkii TaxID=6728 RepID=UPI0037423090